MRLSSLIQTSTGMLINYLKTALRSLRKQGIFAFLNVIGLSTGIACFLLIALFIKDEISFDKLHKQIDRIYRGMTIYESGWYMGFPDPMVKTMTERIPEIESVARIDVRQNAIMEYQGQLIFEKEYYKADPQIFQIFDFPLLYGSESDALQQDNGIVISRDIMNKYFEGKNPVGQTLEMKNEKAPFVITGVLDEIPKNSRFRFNFITKLPEPTFAAEKARWNTSGLTFFLLSPDTKVENVNEKLKTLAEEIAFPSLNDSRFLIESFGRLHLNSDYTVTANGVTGDKQFLQIFSLIGIIILAIACINYINSATAHSHNRNKEIGVRRAVGATGNQIRKQFLAETFCVTTMAVFLAAGLVEALVPSLNQLSGKELSMGYFSDPYTLPFLLLMIPVVTLIAGFYPAIFSSRTSTLDLVKKNGATGKGYLRHTLVVFQFAITLTLIYCTQIILRQVQALHNNDVGINTDLVISPRLPYGSDVERLRTEFKEVAGVEMTSTYFPFASQTKTNIWFEEEGQLDSISLNYYRVEPNAPEFYEMQILQGETFNSSSHLHESQVLISDDLAAKLPFENCIGQLITVLNEDRKRVKRIITGVYQNLHFNAKKENGPSIMLGSREYYNIELKIPQVNQEATILKLRDSFTRIMPDMPFEYYYLSDRIIRKYKSDLDFGKAIRYASGIAIIIAILGLIGLSSFTVVRKQKEMGVRKVLGATRTRLTMQLLWRYISLLLLASLVAIPLAYYLMEKWLTSFAFPIRIPEAIFLLGLLLTLLIVFLSVGYQTIRAASINPVKILRDE